MPFLVDYVFQDNNGKKAQARARFAGDFNQVASAAQALATALVSASDARLVSFTVRETFKHAGAVGPELTSDCTRAGILFYRNGDAVSSISLPSVRTLYADADGPYAGRRICRTTLELYGVLATMDNLLAGTQDPTGRDFGTYFSVGGIV